MSRELKLTQDGRIISMFLHILRSDPDFDIHKPITDTYLAEVGHECGLSEDHMEMVISMLIRTGLVRFK